MHVSGQALASAAGRTVLAQIYAHTVLVCGLVFVCTPILLILLASTHDTATLQQQGLQWHFGGQALKNYTTVLRLEAGIFDQVTPLIMLRNSLLVAIGVAVLTTLFSLLTAYAITYFRMYLSSAIFWLVLATLLFPLESRFVTTFQVTANLGLVNTHIGMVLPVLAAALGTFFFRQYFLTLPNELLEAAILDGAGPLRFLMDFILPLSIPRTGAIFIVAFMIGWNQYLWPLMISTDDALYTLVRGIRLLGQESGPGMAMVVITILPPFVLLLIFQWRFFHALADKA